MGESHHAQLTREFLDRETLFDLVRRERFARDSGDWNLLADLYIEDSNVRTTWFKGSGKLFASRSKEMADKGRHSRHPIWPIYAKVDGDRAVVESYSQIQNRSVIDGVEVDMLQNCRFISSLVRQGAEWRFRTFEAIYQNDSIQSTDPQVALPWPWTEFTGFRPSYRVWAWAMTRRGYDVDDQLLGDDRPDLVAAYYVQLNQWLAGRA
jgi:hypothetical protein